MRAINTQHLDAGTNICSLEGGEWSEQGHVEKKSTNNKGREEPRRRGQKTRAVVL